MTEFLLQWVLSATVLTAAVLLLRAAFGRRISARLRYALWVAVLVRLLVPVQLFTAPVETPRESPEAPGVQAVQTVQGPIMEEAPLSQKTEAVQPVQTIPSPEGEASAGSALEARRPFNWRVALGWTWLLGSAVLAVVFGLSNFRFYCRLRRVRVPLEGMAWRLKVYTAAGLPSPCLFGVLRPAVYVTPEAAENLTMLSHVLAHEATHFRHGDHIWSLLRCAALAIHWWNPLVWLAAVLSRRDAELACDEGALKRLGDGERRAYGNTLLALVTARPRPGDLLSCATTMTGDRRSLQERIGRIARTPKRWLWAAVLAAVLAGLVCACSFAKTVERQPDGPLTQEELDHFNNEVFNGEGFNILNQFVYLAVEAPEDYRHIDLSELFYNGTGASEPCTGAERQAVADAAWGGEDPGTGLVKSSVSQMDAVLQEYLGLTLEETDKWGLDHFVYLEEYGAYYSFHGNTNYLSNVTFTAGERKEGKLFLYYEGDWFPVVSDADEMTVYGMGEGLFCLTLEEQKDGGFHFISNWKSESLEGTKPAVHNSEDGRKENFYTALMLCLDSSSGGNTDVILLAGYDAAAQKATVMSIPRDTMVNVPWDLKRINSVCNYYGGGEEGLRRLQEEIARLVGFEPDFRVVMDWEAVAEIVDSMGGVYFDVPVNMDYEDPYQDLSIHQAAGRRLLSGSDAAQVLRYRRGSGAEGGYPDGDLGRIRTQQAFLKAMTEQILQTKNIQMIGVLAKTLKDGVETDMSASNILWLLQSAVKGGLKAEDVSFVTMPGTAQAAYSRTTDSMQSYVIPDAGALLELVNGSLSPLEKPLSIADLDVMSVNAGGSVSSSTGYVRDQAAASPSEPESQRSEARRTVLRYEAEKAADLSLEELLDYYYSVEYEEPNAAYSLPAMAELLQRFQRDPAAVLSALADREQGEKIADSLGGSLWLNRHRAPGALEQAKLLELEGEQAALRERIAAAYEAKRQEA